MSDPFRSPPGTNPPRHVRNNNVMEWTLGATAGALILGLIAWGMVGNNRTVSSPSPVTTGQGDRIPKTPLPANPSGTTPQRDPAQPAPAAR
jgi:hypothetical protein